MTELMSDCINKKFAIFGLYASVDYYRCHPSDPGLIKDFP